MYLHCHNCDFTQDDYWSESYNPITFLENNYKRKLLDEPLYKITEMQRDVKGENGYVFYMEKITNKELIARELENAARRIRKMKFKPREDAKIKNPEWKCPICGKKELDED